MEVFNNYKRFVRPELADLLKVLNLDVIYHKGKGNKMYYRNKEGLEVEVSDYLSGYGAGLFGHNHPELVEAMISALKADTVFLGQASIRSGAAELAKTLSERIGKFTGKEYITVFGNSGSEAVEAALKHSVIYYRERANSFLYKSRNLGTTHARLQEVTEKLPDELSPYFEVDGFSLTKSKEVVYNYNQKLLKKPPLFLAMKNAFHGKTSGSLNLTYNNSFRLSTQDLKISSDFIEDIEDLSEKISEHTLQLYCLKQNAGKIILEKVNFVAIAAFFVEPIQGEGGINVLSKNYAQQIQEICKANQILIIADEIQCGMGRTGTFLFSEQIGLDADCYLLSKSLGGGLCKISATIFTKSHFVPQFSLIHTSTFSEDDISCNVALKALRMISEPSKILNKIKKSGNALKNELKLLAQQFPDVIKEVKGEGLMLGIEFKERTLTKSNVIHFLEHYNLLGYAIAGFLLHEFNIRIAPALSHGHTIRIEPSYMVNKEEMMRLLEAFTVICTIFEKDKIGHLLAHLLGKSFRDLQENDYYFDFQSILEYKNPKLPKVAFIGHFINSTDITFWDPGLNAFSNEDLEVLLKRIRPIAAPLVYNRITVQSISGKSTQIMFIGLPIASNQIYEGMKNGNEAVKKMVSSAVDMAISEECSVIGLGGYSSIVTRNGKDLDDKGIAITTGNSFTVASVLQAIHNVAIENFISLEDKIAAVIGATGNIGSIIAEILADQVKQIYLISRSNKKESLFPLAGKIMRNLIQSGKYKNLLLFESLCSLSDVELYFLAKENLESNMPVLISDDLNDLRSADIIVSASNQPGSIIFPQMLKDDLVILLDISVPADADESIKTLCPNVKVIKGGIIAAPLNFDYYIPGIPLKKGELFACMTETILMGLEDMKDHYSIGAISKKQVMEIWNLAKKHGFLLSRVKSESSY